MEQKTINQNKLQTLLCIIVLTLGVLVSAVLFSMPPVHAAESSGWSLSSNAGVYKWEYIDIFEDDQTYLTKASMTLDASDQSYFYAFVRLPSDSYTSGFEWRAVRYKIGQDYDISKDQNSLFFTENPMLYEFSYRFGKESTDTQTDSVVRIGDGVGVSLNFNNRKFHSLAVAPFLPCFESFDALRAYCVFGDKSGLVSVPELPNNTDETYNFTGFSMNGKTARWTGTTERSFAKEVDVEEYVKVSYVWATTTEPDNLGELQSYDGEFPTSDKRLTLPWSEMENGKTDFQFIRQIKIFPCYRVPHLAYYIGQPVTIYYNTDGSIDKISNPNTPGILDDSIPIPVLSVNNDKGTFLFANAQNNYKFELKGRFWSTDDFYVFRKMPSLVWQYKYLTLLKNSLTTWVSVGDNMSTLSTYSFGDLGKESWNDLLNTYPIENRNIITGEQQGWLSWANITGYNDAITTLKTLLSTPYSLFNGYEVYVRYYVVCDDGSIKYSKWTHYFDVV